MALREKYAPFSCAICDRPANARWFNDDSIPPICRTCEVTNTPLAAPFGAFKDRRIVRQIFAMAQAVETEANRQIWGGKYGGA